ncbi:MAG: hypothetical protein E7157_02715 [Lactobacillales bacterium]|nr:hypothetical protein [Lactobacillales bacterium]
MNSGLYSLIVRDLDTNEFVVIPIQDQRNNDIRRKVNVSSIDNLTTGFENEQALIECLCEKGYIKNKNVDIFITYKNDGKQKFLQPLYKEYEYFRGFIQESETKIDPKNEYFIYYQDIIFTELNKIEVRNYILNECPNLYEKTLEHINLAYYSKSLEEVNYFKKKIISDLTNYRTLRDIVLNINEFYNPNLKMDRLLKTENRRRALAKQVTKEEELLAQTINISIPTDFENEETLEHNNLPEENNSQLFEDAKAFKNEGQEIMEMVDLDDIIYSLTDDEALALGIDKSKMDEYVGRARK